MVSIRKAVTGAALVGSTLVGGAIGATFIGSANAQTTTTTQAPATTNNKGGTTDGPHQANGITETPLTGDAKSKAEAVASAAVPGASVERSETDAEGATYEVHMTKSDGSHVTVKLDKDFKVTGIESGPDGHGAGRPGTRASNAAA